MLNCSPEVRAFAEKWMNTDPAYINHAAQFGSPLVRRIAKFILEITGKKKGEEAKVS